MAKSSVSMFLLAIFLIICIGSEEVMSQQMECCAESHIGRCIPGVDDKKCFDLCHSNCSLGGYCIVHPFKRPNHFCRCNSEKLCAGLKHMHGLDLPNAHNGVKPGNILITHRKGKPPLTIIMDFGSARPARKQIRSRSEALQLQEWASEHCSAPFRAPELWDCPSHADIDEKTDIWSLGCTLFAIMYGASPFEYALEESEGNLLAVINAQIKWPTVSNPPYPEALHKFVTWMLQPHATIRPCIEDIIIHVDKLISKFSVKR